MKKLLGVLATFLAVNGTANATLIESTFTGTIFKSTDSRNFLGYGGSNLADGAHITITFRWDTANAPGDYYGGARFPTEADYQTFGFPNWIGATVRFDNGFTLSSSSFNGSEGLEQQVKIQDNCARCSFDVLGGAAWDYYGNFKQVGHEPADGRFLDTFVASARIFDYTQNLINSLDIDQLLTWSPGSPGTHYADGAFAYRHVDRQDSANDFAAEGNVHIDSLRVRAIPEPETYALMLAGLGLLGMAVRRQGRG